jgi:hypothetical protein
MLTYFRCVKGTIEGLDFEAARLGFFRRKDWA